MIEQGSSAWFAQRIGKLTASRLADALAKTKSGYSASRANYMAQLVAERLTGVPAEGYTNAAMQHGIDTEPLARAAYEFHTDNTVEPAGFIDHPVIEMTGASPDGLVGDDGLVEIKCPNTATHIETLLSGVIPSKYILQMEWQMACTGRQWCDYISFDPRMPENMRLFIARQHRGEALIARLENDVIEFLGELDRKVDDLRRLYPLREAA
jgi:putative phage-type endonuclease